MGPPSRADFRKSTLTTGFKEEPERATAPYYQSARCEPIGQLGAYLFLSHSSSAQSGTSAQSGLRWVEITATHRAMLCCRSQFFGGTGLPYSNSCLAALIQKVVAMLAEIFMVRSEAEARLVEDILPSSTSAFIPFGPSGQFVFKETGLKGDEAPSEEQPARVVR